MAYHKYPCYTAKDMITLLLGSDSLAKKQHIAEASKLRGAEVEVFTENSTLPPLPELFEQQLFGAPKMVVLDHIWKQLDSGKVLEEVGNSKSASLYIVEESLDKRKTVNQAFLKDSRVSVMQLDAPVGVSAVGDWIDNYSKELKISIEPSATNALARALVTDEDTVMDVARAQSELAKLKAYANGQSITSSMVATLVESEVGVDIFELLNAIATKNKKQAIEMLNRYFETETADEKTNAIKLAALLSDQFRSLLIAIDATNRQLPDQMVLEMTNWKSGRLYVMKKLSRNFTVQKVRQILSKLENLDRELKTGSMPPHVVLDLIISEI
jgi:DNA polymerase III subunit delta